MPPAAACRGGRARSHSNALGSASRARSRLTRAFWPPESAPGSLSPEPPSPTSASASRAWPALPPSPLEMRRHAGTSDFRPPSGGKQQVILKRDASLGAAGVRTMCAEQDVPGQPGWAPGGSLLPPGAPAGSSCHSRSRSHQGEHLAQGHPGGRQQGHRRGKRVSARCAAASGQGPQGGLMRRGMRAPGHDERGSRSCSRP